ncbi:MAG: hypothetical protein LUI10_13535 [Lachnospiraceae bacterium]|nr:hypothetical protein [Lachnospiraceae bacterium]
MRNLLKFEIRRVRESKAVYIAIAIGAMLSLWLLVIELREVHEVEEGIALYGLEKAGLYYPRSLYNSFIGLEYAYLPSTILYTVFPLLVSFPYAVSYFSDQKSGYLKNILTACDKKQYFKAKYIAVFLSGVFVTFAILMFSLVLSAMFFPALKPELTTSTFTPQSEAQMWTGLYVAHPLVYTLLYILIDTIFYGLISTLPLLIGLIAQNRVTVICVPVLLYVMSDYVLNAAGLDRFSPMAFLRPCQIFVEAEFVIIVCEAVMLFLLTAGTFGLSGGRKDVL